MRAIMKRAGDTARATRANCQSSRNVMYSIETSVNMAVMKGMTPSMAMYRMAILSYWMR